MVDNYLEKVYSGFLGMNIGIRIGAPVEPTIWTYERIRDTYGDITDYVKNYKNFAADDDANGPYYFLRALYDKKHDGMIEPNDVANAWLNYARENKGMFWWGGYGISTEHTAYLNLKNGIKAPKSGSMELNGKIVAEQIGGQIFIDTWGLISPGNPELAANLGEIAASVSHDGEGLYGARFICACIAEAFVNNDIEDIISIGLSKIPIDSDYNKVSQAVIKFYKENPDDFRACREMLTRDWGYDKFTGVCHIIPNAGICVLSMLYGKGDFNKTVEIATMCGWDTDCNAGNVGTILGVMCGVSGIRKNYLDPINDSIVMSGISGDLNILDIPTYSKELAILGYDMLGENPPKELIDSFTEKGLYFDFELPGSTHNFRISDEFKGSISHSNKRSFSGKGSLQICFDRLLRGDNFKVFYKPFYTRDDFSDERYSPVFSGKVYSGQICEMKIFQDQWNGNENMHVAPFVRLAFTNEIINLGYIKLKDQEWNDIKFVIPDTNGSIIDEIGIIVEGTAIKKYKNLGMLYLDDFKIYGEANYKISINKQKNNFGNITPFSYTGGAWTIENDKMQSMTINDESSFTGNYFSTDYSIISDITPLYGENHLINIRSRGVMEGYLVGFTKENEVGLILNNYGKKEIYVLEYNWKYDVQYKVEVIACGDNITFKVNDEIIFEVQDKTYTSGMYGFSRIGMGRTLYGNIQYKDISIS